MTQNKIQHVHHIIFILIAMDRYANRMIAYRRDFISITDHIFGQIDTFAAFQFCCGATDIIKIQKLVFGDRMRIGTILLFYLFHAYVYVWS